MSPAQSGMPGKTNGPVHFFALPSSGRKSPTCVNLPYDLRFTLSRFEIRANSWAVLFRYWDSCKVKKNVRDPLILIDSILRYRGQCEIVRVTLATARLCLTKWHVVFFSPWKELVDSLGHYCCVLNCWYRFYMVLCLIVKSQINKI